jgi:hypothetical protein
MNLFNPDKKNDSANLKESFYNTDGRKPYKKTANITPQLGR